MVGRPDGSACAPFGWYGSAAEIRHPFSRRKGASPRLTERRTRRPGGSQSGACAGQSELHKQCTHLPVGPLQRGVSPVHWASVLHCAHTPLAPQLAALSLVMHALPAMLQQPPPGCAVHAVVSHVHVAELPLPVHLSPGPHAAPVAPHLHAPPLHKFALAPSAGLGQVTPAPHWQVKAAEQVSLTPAHALHNAPLVPQVAVDAVTQVLPGPLPLQQALAALQELVSH